MLQLLRRLVPILTAISILSAPLAAEANGASPACTATGSKGQGSLAQSAQLSCQLWQPNVPVYAAPAHRSPSEAADVGTLQGPGPSGHFFAQCEFIPFTLSANGQTYTNSWWAQAQLDNGKIGFVPEAYFTGNDEPQGQAGLPFFTGSSNGICPSTVLSSSTQTCDSVFPTKDGTATVNYAGNGDNGWNGAVSVTIKFNPGIASITNPVPNPACGKSMMLTGTLNYVRQSTIDPNTLSNLEDEFNLTAPKLAAVAQITYGGTVLGSSMALPDLQAKQSDPVVKRSILGWVNQSPGSTSPIGPISNPIPQGHLLQDLRVCVAEISSWAKNGNGTCAMVSIDTGQVYYLASQQWS